MGFTLFGKLKKGAGAEATRTQAPMGGQKPSVEDRISLLVSQGLAEPEIIKTLKDEGYSFQEIDGGISNVLRSRVANEPQQQMQGQEFIPPEDLSPIMPAAEDMQNSPQKIRAEVVDQMDAVMEQMMEEKLSSLAGEFDKIDAKFEDVDNKMQRIIARMNEVENIDKKSGERAESKIIELASKDSAIEPRIAGLERAFKDIIPGLVESIRELKEIVTAKKREASISEVERELDINLGDETHAKDKGANIFD